MKTLSHSQKQPVNSKLDVKQLQVLWLYDCNFSDEKIQLFLILDSKEFHQIKSSLLIFFHAENIGTLLDSAFTTGYVHKFVA